MNKALSVTRHRSMLQRSYVFFAAFCLVIAL